MWCFKYNAIYSLAFAFAVFCFFIVILSGKDLKMHFRFLKLREISSWGYGLRYTFVPTFSAFNVLQ